MQRAVYISKIETLSELSGSYDRLYFGTEFCEHLLPTVKALKRAQKEALDRDWQFTLVTPYVTDAGLARLEKLLPLLSEGDEVVVNDWGVLDWLAADFPQLTALLGRLLTKQKRGPRIMNVVDIVPPAMLSHFRRSNVDTPHLHNWLIKKMNVARFELDYPLQGIERRADVPASLYTPWMYVSTTRLCLTNHCENRTQSLRAIFTCDHACQRHAFTLKHPNMPATLHLAGNTIFVRRDDLPANMEELGIDRLVIMPEIPI